MYFKEVDIRQVTETVWDVMLHATADLGTQTRSGDEAQWVSATVRVTGSWNGTVTLFCPPDVARDAAGTMYQSPPDSLTMPDVLDAVGELANMIGGNVRALLPEPCLLSLPVVFGHGDTPKVNDAELFELPFSSRGRPFWVRLASPQ